jgi:hypothetical protein
MRSRLLATLMLASCVLAGQAAGATRAEQASAKPEAEFPLEPYRKTIALRGSVRGTPGLFLFDTAGGITLLSPEYARKVGCKPWGRLVGHRMMGERLDTPRCDDVPITLGGMTLKAPVAALLDVTKLLPEGAAPVEGSIALDLFAGRAITIDFPGQRLLIESPASLKERASRAKQLPALLSRELQGRALAMSVGVPSPDGPVWMELDTGNGGSLLVAKPYAALFGLDPAEEGPQAADFAISPDFRAKGTAFAPDMILDGNLGMPFLRDKVVTFDLATGRLWIEAPNPSAAPPDGS